MILPIGRYLATDAQGFIIPDVSHSHIMPPWDSLVKASLDLIATHAPNITSVYIRGSVPRGLAVEGISDLDLILIGSVDDAAQEQMDLFDQSLAARFPFCTGIEWGVVSLGDLQKIYPPHILAYDQSLLKTQGLLLAGIDVVKDIAPLKIDINMTSHAFSIEKEWQQYPQWLMEAETPVACKHECRWMAKRIIRTAFELHMQQAGVFTRDLYLCYETAAKYMPETAKSLYKVLELAIEPTDDGNAIIRTMTPAMKAIIAALAAKKWA